MSDETSIELNYAFKVKPADSDASLYSLLRLNSNIDPTMPEEGNATTASVRENFAYSKYEIESLQAAVQTLGGELNSQTADYVSTKGDKMTGALTLEASITDPKHAVTKEWVETNFTGGGGGTPIGSIKWSNITDVPQPIEDLSGDNATMNSFISAGSY